ncbi:MAG: hypothetical protein HC895_05670 [Leptolyngbyaceae cyanobacterium SM1_3_5]|nr:hypothetical protein [Leptolyngbyaceae cyanobacterium SM1_3_5]
MLKLLGTDSIEQAESLLPFVAIAQSPETQQEVELQRADGSSIQVLLSTVISQIDSIVAIDGLVEAIDR